MLTKIRSHVTHNVIAYCALFLALGGTSYGLARGSIDSREIKNNTVRTGDLRNNEVRSRDIRNRTIVGRDILGNALGGDQVDEAELGKVPLATRAESADNALAFGGQQPGAFARAVANTQDVNDENAPTTVLTVAGFGTVDIPNDGCEADGGSEELIFDWKNTSSSSQDVFVDVQGVSQSHEVVGANQVSSSTATQETVHAEFRIRQLNSNAQAVSIDLFAQNGGAEVGDDCRISAEARIVG